MVILPFNFMLYCHKTTYTYSVEKLLGSYSSKEYSIIFGMEGFELHAGNGSIDMIAVYRSYVQRIPLKGQE